METSENQTCLRCKYINNGGQDLADKPELVNFTEFFSFTKNLLRLKKKKEKNAIKVMYGIKTKRTCRFGESGIGRTAPRMAGSFPKSPSEATWVRETSSHTRCVQSRTHRTCQRNLCHFGKNTKKY